MLKTLLLHKLRFLVKKKKLSFVFLICLLYLVSLLLSNNLIVQKKRVECRQGPVSPGPLLFQQP